MHALVADQLYSGTDAAHEVLIRLPLGRLAASLGLHRLYPLVARHRASLGRWVRDHGAPAMCGTDRRVVRA